MSEPEFRAPRSGSAPVSCGPLLEFPEDPIACMRRLQVRHGDLAVLEDAGQRLVFVFSPDLNREVLSNAKTFHSQFFAVRGGRQSAQRRVTSGLLSQNGAEHRDMRRVLKDVFALRVLPGYLNTISQITHRLCDNWSVGSAVDLNAGMVQFMLNVTSALLFGEDDVQFANHLGQMIDRWVHQNHRVGIGALVSAPEFAAEYDRLLTMAEELEVVVQELIARQKLLPSARPNVLSLLLAARCAEQGLTDQGLVGQTTLLFGAAHLTTAHTLSWTLLLLSQHPEVMVPLLEEIRLQTTDEDPSLEQLERCVLLDRVIRESMRVLPASSYSQRVTSEATALAGHRLSAGTPVVFSQFMTHHRADLYEQPDSFLPDRWMHVNPGPYEYLPFGAGPRMCIGAPLAMLELKAALSVMLRRLHFQIVPGSTVNARVISTMLSPTTPIRAEVIPVSRMPEPVLIRGSIHDLVRLPEAASAAARAA